MKYAMFFILSCFLLSSKAQEVHLYPKDTSLLHPIELIGEHKYTWQQIDSVIRIHGTGFTAKKEDTVIFKNAIVKYDTSTVKRLVALGDPAPHTLGSHVLYMKLLEVTRIIDDYTKLHVCYLTVEKMKLPYGWEVFEAIMCPTENSNGYMIQLKSDSLLVTTMTNHY